jgi:hypothetical protein
MNANANASTDEWQGSRQIASRHPNFFLVCLFHLYLFYPTDNFLSTTNDNEFFFGMFVSPLSFFFYSTDNFLSTTNDDKFFFGMFVSPLSFFSILLMTS